MKGVHMKMKRVFAISLSTLLLLLSMGVAEAHPRGRGYGYRRSYTRHTYVRPYRVYAPRVHVHNRGCGHYYAPSYYGSGVYYGNDPSWGIHFDSDGSFGFHSDW